MQRYLLLSVLALVVVFVPAQAARSDVASQCVTRHGANGPPFGLGVTIFSFLNYDVPEGSSSASGSASLPLYPSWNVLFGNTSAATVTDPAITVTSGLPGLSSSCSQSGLDPGGILSPNLGPAFGSVRSGSLGYDSSATATPSVLPPGGGEVTERFTVTVTGRAFAAGAGIFISTGNGDVNVLSQGIPQNLDHGETVSTDGNEWNLSGAQLDTPYVFTALVQVGAAGPAPAPYVFFPPAFIQVSGQCTLCVHSIGSSVTVPDANLDGAFTFSVDQPDQSWNIFDVSPFQTNYAEQTPTLTADMCKHAGWQSYGIFANQGDCVSYVATNGKNPPR